MISIDDLFKCSFTLDRLHNCGYLSEYLDSFADWMAGHRYADFTIRKRVSDVAHLSFSLETKPDLGLLPDLIHKRSLQATLRSFFDFCHEIGHTSQNLRFSLPVIKSYRLLKVPRKIEDKEAIKLINSLDRSTDSGKRTYSILRILHTYGVRGCQLRALKLDDIN